MKTNQSVKWSQVKCQVRWSRVSDCGWEYTFWVIYHVLFSVFFLLVLYFFVFRKPRCRKGSRMWKVSQFLSLATARMHTPTGKLSQFLSLATARMHTPTGKLSQFLSLATARMHTPTGKLSQFLSLATARMHTPTGKLSQCLSLATARMHTPTGKLSASVHLNSTHSLHISGSMPVSFCFLLAV